MVRKMSSQTSPIVLNNLIPVKEAAESSGYSPQYLRRLLRTGKLVGRKLGQVWLIEKSAFEDYLENATQAADRRFGSKCHSKQVRCTYFPL